VKKISQKIVKSTFLVDALISCGFGVVSFLIPHQTYGTIIAIPPTNEALFLAILASMSILYILIGLIAAIGWKAPYPIAIWIAVLMLIRHSWLGIMKTMDINQEWIVGDPYPDIVIHSLFVLVYTVGIIYSTKHRKKVDISAS
jgi:hypothetical protein